MLVVLGIVAWHWSQRLIGARPPLPEDAARITGALLTQGDALLVLATPLNAFLRENAAWSDALLIVSSATIDLLGLLVLARAIFGPSVRPFIGLLVLFSLRQTCLTLTSLPPPDGVIWHYPGFPSLLVTYDVGNDLFFSGHTALAVYGALELASFGRRSLAVAGLAIAIFEITTVLALHAHYTMDVFAGAVAALVAAGLARRLAPGCDRLLGGAQ